MLLDEFPVHVVDDWGKLEKLMQEISDEVTIAIDSEWKPHFVSTKEEIALIQIATSTAVYLVDVVVLEQRLTTPQWHHFFKILLCGNGTTRIGALC